MPESAPYRFVPLSETVVPSPVQKPSHAEPLPNQKSGHIDVVWLAHGSLLLGDRGSDAGGSVRPFLLAPDSSAGQKPKLADAAIPGTSLRGMLRAVFEIVTYSRLSLLNGRYRFGFRDFDDGDYASVLKAGSVKAGWLELDDDGSLHLRPVEWRKVSIGNLVTLVETCNEGKEWIFRSISEKYEKFGVYDRSQAPNYRWHGNFFWSESAERVFTAADSERPDDCLACDLVFSGKLPPPGAGGAEPVKEFEYAFIADESASRHAVDSEIYEDFCRVHGKPRADGGIEPDGSWAELAGNFTPGVPSEHRRVPVFFVGEPDDQLNQRNRLRMGLTRLFKLAHRFAVGDLVPASHGARLPLDMTESLFGYVDEPPDEARPTALRSRVAVGIAGITEESAKACRLGEVEAVLMTPRASFDPYYLTLLPANRDAKLSYSAADKEGKPLVRLAGRKRYPVRGAPARDEMQRIARRAAKNVKSRLQFLERQDQQPIQFKSRIRFHNLHPVELGALVWTLRLGGYGYHSIGRAKPYGFGRLSVADQSSIVVNGGPGRTVKAAAPELEKPFLDHMQAQLKAPLLQQWPIKLLLYFAQTARMDPLAADGMLSYPGAHSNDANSAKAYNQIKKRRREDERLAAKAVDGVTQLRAALREPVLALKPRAAARNT